MAESQQTPPAGKAGAAARVAARRAAKAARKAAQRDADAPVIEEEEILETVEAASSWLDENQRLLWGGFAAVVLVGAVILGISSTRQKADREAADSMVEAAKTAIAPVIPEIEASEGDDKAEQETFPTAKARAQEALSDFRATLKAHAGTAPGRWAKVGEANALLELGDYQAALDAYKAVDAKAGSEDFLRFRSLEGQGLALEGLKKYDDALSVFEESAKVSDGLYQAQATLNVARMLRANGKDDEAIKRLQEMITAVRERDPEAGLDDSFFVEQAETRLSELGAPVAKGAGGLSADLMEQLRRQFGGNIQINQDPAAGTKGE